MILLSLLDTFIKQIYLLLILATVYIISVIITRILKKKEPRVYYYIVREIAKLLIVSVIPVLITLYSSIITITNIANIHISETVNLLLSLSAIISLGVSIILGIAILFMEGERFESQLIKEVENTNINNLEKIGIKLLDATSFILSIILVYSILLLAIFPTNTTLINAIMAIPQIYLYIIVFNILSSITISIKKAKERNTNARKI